MLLERLALFPLFFILPSNVAFAGSMGACEAEFIRAAAATSVPLGVLYSVGLTESGRKGRLHPFALNVDGVSAFPRSSDEAAALMKASLKAGARFVDVGCMQINYQFHRSEFKNDNDMLNPRLNVLYGARLLARLRDREGTWTMAVARYNAGAKNHSAHHKYICRVIENLVLSGLGGWTDRSRQVCRANVTRSAQ